MQVAQNTASEPKISDISNDSQTITTKSNLSNDSEDNNWANFDSFNEIP